jgi:hypothetical protein
VTNESWGRALKRAVPLAICAAVIYLRRVPRGSRPSWRSWVLALPVLLALALAATVWLGVAMRGALTG